MVDKPALISQDDDIDIDDDNSVVGTVAQSWQNSASLNTGSSSSEPAYFGALENWTRKGAEFVAKAADRMGLRSIAGDIRGAGRVALRIEHAAGQITEVTGNYLTDLANHESRNNPLAHAPTSSAAGLDQFLKQTWLGTVYKHGSQYPGALAEAAQHIHFVGKRYVVDSGRESEVLNLRYDRNYSNQMALAYTRDNAAYLQTHGVTNPSNAELYLAHLLGAGTAIKFIHADRNSPNAIARDMLPTEAASNHGVFFAHGGRARTVDEVVKVLAADFIPSTSHPAHMPRITVAANTQPIHPVPQPSHGRHPHLVNEA